MVVPVVLPVLAAKRSLNTTLGVAGDTDFAEPLLRPTRFSLRPSGSGLCDHDDDREQVEGGVHDHAHAWVLYGVLDGKEFLERFERLDDFAIEHKAFDAPPLSVNRSIGAAFVGGGFMANVHSRAARNARAKESA